MRRREIRTACFPEGGSGLPMEEADSGMRPAAEYTVGFGHRRRDVRAEAFDDRRKNGVVRSVVVLSDGFVGIGRRASGKNACRSGLRGGSIDRFSVSRKRAASGGREDGPVGRRIGRSSGKSDAVGAASGVGDRPDGGSVLGGRMSAWAAVGEIAFFRVRIDVSCKTEPAFGSRFSARGRCRKSCPASGTRTPESGRLHGGDSGERMPVGYEKGTVLENGPFFIVRELRLPSGPG